MSGWNRLKHKARQTSKAPLLVAHAISSGLAAKLHGFQIDGTTMGTYLDGH